MRECEMSISYSVAKKRTRVSMVTAITRWPTGGVIILSSGDVFFQDIEGAMRLVCEILTADPEGGAARVPLPLFEREYRYLSTIDGDISLEHVNTVIDFFEQHAYALHIVLIASVANSIMALYKGDYYYFYYYNHVTCVFIAFSTFGSMVRSPHFSAPCLASL